MDVLSVVHGEDARTELFGPVVAAAGHRLAEWSFESGGAPPAADAVLVFGGAMHPDQDDAEPVDEDELAWLASSIEGGVPTLGICLGSQLLARAAGSWVGPLETREVGWAQVELTEDGVADAVLGALPRALRRARVASLPYGLPEGAVELARNYSCLQAFRLGLRAGASSSTRRSRRAARAPGPTTDDDPPRSAALREESRRHFDEWNDSAGSSATRSSPLADAAREALALERELVVPAPLVPGAGVVARVVARRAQRERCEGRARAGVAVRDDLRSLRQADELADALRRRRLARARRTGRRRRGAARRGCVPAAGRTRCRLARCTRPACGRRGSSATRRRAAPRSRRASAWRAASARGRPRAPARARRLPPPRARPAGHAAEQDGDVRMPGELGHLERRHRADSVAAVDEHEPLAARDPVPPQPQRDLLRERRHRRLVGAGRRRAEHERARAGDVAAHVRVRAAHVADDEILVPEMLLQPRSVDDRVHRAATIPASAATAGRSSEPRDPRRERRIRRRSRRRACRGRGESTGRGDVGERVLRAGEVRLRGERARRASRSAASKSSKPSPRRNA